MSVRSFLRDMLDDSPRYAERGDGPVNLTLPEEPLTGVTRDSGTWDFMFGLPGLPGLPAVTERTAVAIAAVYACVNLIAGTVSSLTSPIYRRQEDGEHEEIYGDPLWWILNEQFLPRWNAANGWEFVVMSLLFHGDGFGIIHRKSGFNSGSIEGIEPVHPLKVDVLKTADRKRLIYAVQHEQGQLEVYDQDDVLHFAGFGFDGCRGMSPLRHHLRMAGSVALATQEYAGRFFANGARSDIHLKTDQKLTPEQASEIRDMWREQHQGLQNAHRPSVLGQGVEAKALSLSAQDAQLLETRRFSVEEIARIYGVPPFMIGQTDKTTSWGSGVETMGTGFVRFTLRQHLTKIEKEINRKFFRTAGKFVEFDTFELERADMKTLFTAYGQAIGGAGRPGFMTAEEIRNRLRMRRKPAFGTLHSGEGAPAKGSGAAPLDDEPNKEDAPDATSQAA